MKLSFFIPRHGIALSYVDYVSLLKVDGEYLYLHQDETPDDLDTYNRRVVSFILANGGLLVTSSVCSIDNYERDVKSGLKITKIRMHDVIDADYEIHSSQKNATWVPLSEIHRLWEDEYTYDILNGPVSKEETYKALNTLLDKQQAFIQSTKDRMHDTFKKEKEDFYRRLSQDENSRTQRRTRKRSSKSRSN